ncbi:hypothetical protein BAE46_14085 [Glaciecola punicea]|uniref:cytosine permease n=1 Tax=Glaciecola punicea TaxID=56804 RepID=UPI000872C422|nr:cytosine permease [Glaciecola punicea]OFA29247.1 hypothetical protein BAE46_14085 [Glaciecola punicea]
MSKINASTDNYTHTIVPEKERVNAWHIIAIIVGIAITLPGFLSGAKIMMALGTVKGALAIFTGGLILATIASVTGYVSVCRRRTTYQILDHSFGLTGNRLVSFIMSLTLLGWYAVTASLFGKAITIALKEIFDLYPPEELIIAIGGILMIITTIFGLKAISMLAKLSVPLMLLVLGAGIYYILDDYSLSQILSATGRPSEAISSFGAAVSITVGSFMVGVVIIPDYARYLQKKSQAIQSAFYSFAVFNTIIMVFAGLPGLITGQADFITAMYKTGLGIPALFVMAFATWTSNVGNLYSFSLSAAQLFPKVADWKLTVGAGILGTVIAIIGSVELFIPFLVILSITLPPIAGIYISDYFITEKTSIINSSGPHIKNIPVIPFVVWILAIVVAFSTEREVFILTTIPALDSFLLTCISYPLLLKYFCSKDKSFLHTKN